MICDSTVCTLKLKLRLKQAVLLLCVRAIRWRCRRQKQARSSLVLRRAFNAHTPDFPPSRDGLDTSVGGGQAGRGLRSEPGGGACEQGHHEAPHAPARCSLSPPTGKPHKPCVKPPRWSTRGEQLRRCPSEVHAARCSMRHSNFGWRTCGREAKAGTSRVANLRLPCARVTPQRCQAASFKRGF